MMMRRDSLESALPSANVDWCRHLDERCGIWRKAESLVDAWPGVGAAGKGVEGLSLVEDSVGWAEGSE